MKNVLKDPIAVLDWVFDWKSLTNGTGEEDWLASGETISTYTIDEETGITVDSDNKTDGDTSVTVWLSGGTAGNTYNVGCKIVTSAGHTDERTLKVKVLNR